MTLNELIAIIGVNTLLVREGLEYKMMSTNGIELDSSKSTTGSAAFIIPKVWTVSFHSLILGLIID